MPEDGVMTPITGPVASTRAGEIVGEDDGRVTVWKGIRYGEAPTGALRWAAPVAARETGGVIHATTFGAAAPQPDNKVIPLGDGVRTDEDCLFLNVWRPSTAAEGRPVMVWLHGGAYTFGAASQAVYDGTALVTTGDVVLVTINYRLGALGFLDLRSLGGGEDAEPNPALRDVLLALRWVQDNIRAFGGDPGQVTVFGESAGAGLVTALLATPSADGLFHRAIAESSPASSMYGASRAATVAGRFAEQVGVSTLDELRALPVEAIVAAAAQVYDAVPREHPGTLAFSPVVDGELLPEHPITVLSEGRGLPVPLIIGTNRDEATLFRYMNSPLMPIGADAIEQMFATMREEQPELPAPDREQVLAAYAKVKRKAVGLGIARDIGFRMPTVWLAAGHAAAAETYLYRFDHSTPLMTLAGIGAAHGAELAYVWGTLDAGSGPAFRLGGRRTAERISERLQRRWTEFANGRPPGDDWPAYGEPARATLVIAVKDRVVDDLDAALRTGWGDTVLAFR